MIQRLFSGNKPVTAAVIIIYAVVLWLPILAENKAIDPDPDSTIMPLFKIMEGGIMPGSFFAELLALIFILVQAYSLVFLNGRFILVEQRTFLPAFFFISILSFIPAGHFFTESLISGFFILIALFLLFDSNDRDKNSYRFFEAGLFIGLSTLVYGKMIFFLPFIWISSVIFRPFYWREWVLPVIGICLPYLFISGVTYWSEGETWQIFHLLWSNLSTEALYLQPDIPFYVILGILALFVTIASVYMLRIFQFRKIYIRNFYLSFFWLFIISLVVMAFSGFRDAGLFNITAIPVSFILSNYFMNSRKSLGNRLLFSLFLLAMILNAASGFFEGL